MAELPYIGTKELTILFGYKNIQSTHRAISRGTFPVPTYKIAGKRVADIEVVRSFFRRKRDEALACVQEQASLSD